MMIRCAVCCAFLLALTTTPLCAAKPATEKTSKPATKQSTTATKKKSTTARNPAAKPSAKPVAKAPRKPVSKTALRKTQKPGAPAQKTIHKTSLSRNLAPTFAPSPALPGKPEILTCRDGTEDRHARIAVVLRGGRTDSFAYYSKWKPRTCSIYLQRHRDPYSTWSDKGNVTNVNLEQGVFMIEHGKGEYRFVFRDIDRERFCGMDGTINGTLTIRKGSERCEVAGIMEEGVPLGQEYAHLEQQPQPAATASVPEKAPEPPPVRQAAPWWNLRPSQSVFPSSGGD